MLLLCINTKVKKEKYNEYRVSGFYAFTWRELWTELIHLLYARNTRTNDSNILKSDESAWNILLNFPDFIKIFNENFSFHLWHCCLEVGFHLLYQTHISSQTWHESQHFPFFSSKTFINVQRSIVELANWMILEINVTQSGAVSKLRGARGAMNPQENHTVCSWVRNGYPNNVNRFR